MNAGNKIRRMKMQGRMVAITWGLVLLFIVVLLSIGACVAFCR
ncbi:MAG: hypothetical protein AAB731_01330 [Patescibacteria group bacterium]